MDIDKEFEYLREYMEIFIEMRSCQLQDGGWGPIPSFEYYKDNVILDRGGCYDFTRVRHKTYYTSCKIPDFISHHKRVLPYNCVDVYVEYSTWNGIVFNKEIKTRLDFSPTYIDLNNK